VVSAIDVSMVAGLQEPVTLLLDIVGKEGTILFLHKGPICVNAGVVGGIITMACIKTVAH
jgi:hypothetical protein